MRSRAREQLVQDDAGNQADLSRQIVAGPTKPLEEREPRVRRELAAIVEKAMSLTPADRYRDAGELAADLARYQGGRLVVAHRYTRVALAGRWARRHALALSIGVGVAAVAGVAAFALTRSSAPSREAACRKAAAPVHERWNPQTKAKLEAAFRATGAPGVDVALGSILRPLDRYTAEVGAMRIQACTAHARGEQSGAALDLRMACLDRRVARLDAALAVLAAPDPTVVARAPSLVDHLGGVAECADLEMLGAVAPLPDDPAVRAKIKDAQERLEKLMFAMDAGKVTDIGPMDALLAQVRALAYGPLTARALQRAAAEHSDRGDRPTAERELRESVLIAESSGADLVRLGSTILLYGFLSRDRTRDAETQEWARQSFALAERIHAAPELATLWGRKAEFALERGDYENAVESARQALEVIEQMPSPPPDKLAFPHYVLSSALMFSRKYEEGIAELDKAEAFYNEAYGPNSTHQGNLFNSRGNANMVMGKYADAATFYAKALAFEERIAPDGEGLLINLVNLGNAQYMAGQEKEAVVTLERGRALTEKHFGKEHPQYISFVRFLGEIHGYMGEVDAGVAELREALAISTRMVGETDHESISVQIRIGEAYRFAKRWDEAIAAYQRGLALMAKNPNPHAERGWTLSGLGDSLSMAHRWREAIPILEEAISATEAERDAGATATVKFALARSLVEGGRDKARAVKLAREARALLVPLMAESSTKGSIANIDEWLAVYDPPPKPASL
jgi:eukaryotic-like serine/threonine-protein kinase